MLNVKYWRIFLSRHFSAYSSFYCFIWFYLFLRDAYDKNYKFLYVSVSEIKRSLAKPMYPFCDIELWLIKVMIFLWSHVMLISFRHTFYINILIISGDIKYSIYFHHCANGFHGDKKSMSHGGKELYKFQLDRWTIATSRPRNAWQTDKQTHKRQVTNILCESVKRFSQSNNTVFWNIQTNDTPDYNCMSLPSLPL